jgi:hypothetical protein
MVNQVNGDQATSSLADILNTQKNAVIAMNNIVDALTALTPNFTSGQLIAAKLVQTGFVRLLGYSVTTPGSISQLCDAATLPAAASSTVVGTTTASVGYFPVDMVFANGLVYLPVSGQVATLFYART